MTTPAPPNAGQRLEAAREADEDYRNYLAEKHALCSYRWRMAGALSLVVAGITFFLHSLSLERVLQLLAFLGVTLVALGRELIPVLNLGFFALTALGAIGTFVAFVSQMPGFPETLEGPPKATWAQCFLYLGGTLLFLAVTPWGDYFRTLHFHSHPAQMGVASLCVAWGIHLLPRKTDATPEPPGTDA